MLGQGIGNRHASGWDNPPGRGPKTGAKALVTGNSVISWATSTCWASTTSPTKAPQFRWNSTSQRSPLKPSREQRSRLLMLGQDLAEKPSNCVGAVGCGIRNSSGFRYNLLRLITGTGRAVAEPLNRVTSCHRVIGSLPNRIRVYAACLRPLPRATARLSEPFTTNPHRSFLEYACVSRGIAIWHRTCFKKR